MSALNSTHIQRFAALACAWMAACSETPEQRGQLPVPDGVEFVTEVYPLLLRDCAFSNCHGSHERFLEVYGPGRTRLDPELGQDDPMTLDEVLHSYDRARSMLASSADPQEALLVRKPLELRAGGQTHHGVDAFGRNVFSSKQSRGYGILLRWARSSGSAPQQQDVDAANDAASKATLDWLGAGS